ncbi:MULTISPECIES: GH25 family lysozyme [unclassified Clostridium]|uniref:GH25 family lysozyme n=1 Tax=unclassified Clostridium TaxID=2614128 RepID=UPI000297C17B|nr:MULTISPECIES: GH25 family lysozyme [unclassified Clostridium]EKQ51504.1 MAG: lysozyme M1 (1,4-beta-N-acetylmuramidase) [Clostridium sp. Maddingley MBC34-26]
MSYIKGIDVSNNNGSIDFSKVAADGVKYVYVKATEGATFKDSTMEKFYSDSKNNGLKVGAYHFLVGASTPETQAQNFYNKIKDYEWDLVPMMDVETNFSGLSDYVIRFITAFNKLSSLTLGIYTYTSFIDNLSDAEATIKNMPFWEANYNNDPWNLSETFFTNRVGHQYTESGSISGISEGCDVDSFTEGALLDNATKPGEWILKDGKWWYRHIDGSYTTNGWEKINGKWYLFDSEGWMLYDWKKSGSNWYYLGRSDDGSMKSGWLLQDNKWYYLGDSNDGSMKTGWQQIDGKWYYFNSSGAMQTGWIKYNGKDYCLYSDGSMIHDIDLYGYRFDSNGVATKLS